MISVIIPVYNVRDYLDICLQSVVEQTWSAFEIILIDDGSTDGSGKKCEEWALRDTRIRLVRRENQGLGPARNLGIELAKYEYVTFLDSDDWWDTQYLEQMMAPVLESAPDVVCCDIHYWEKDTSGHIRDAISRLRIEPGKRLTVSENPELLNTARTYMWGKVYKKRLFTDNAIVQPAHTYEDVATTPFVIAKAESLYRVDRPLYYYYRKRQGSLANHAAGLWDMKRSLQELMFRFEQEELFRIYQEQLRKLAYSQVRFILKKAQILCDGKEQAQIREVLFDMLARYFPKLKNLEKEIFYVVGRRELKEAVGLIAIEEGQMAERGKVLAWGEDREPEGSLVVELPDTDSRETWERWEQEIEEAGSFFQQGIRLRTVIVAGDREAFGHAWQDKLLSCKGQWQDCRKVEIERPSSQTGADEEYLWNLADKIFYAL